jgi:hypothetical protein
MPLRWNLVDFMLHSKTASSPRSDYEQHRQAKKNPEDFSSQKNIKRPTPELTGRSENHPTLW